MHSGAGNKVVATLRADGNVYPTEASMGQLANLINYKIKTEGELLNKSLNSLNVPTTIVDLGKQLLQCARDSDVNGVKSALARGAPFAADWLGMSAMHFAAMNNQLEICEILLHGGINKDAKTKVDRTPLHLACFYGHERIVKLLLSKKCAINPRDMLRMTPLHWAVEKKHKSIVRLLLKNNADVTATSKFGKTPLALAVLTEQADLLSELEAARQAQANRKLNEETEEMQKSKKETSDAVNSIMSGLSDNIIDEPETTRRIDEQNENESFQASHMDYASKIAGLEELNEEAYSSTTLNMLKNHGIAMMPDEDDASKDMLNTALQNGRRLVLSEGGRMLLHETQRNLKIYSTNTSHNNNKNNNNGHVKTDLDSATTSVAKIRMNVIKPKESVTAAGGITKNKNIRIISLTDFKKLCADKKPNALQKIPASLASSGVVRQLADGTKLVNMRQLQSRKLRLPSVNDKEKLMDDGIIIEDTSAHDSSEDTAAKTTSRVSINPATPLRFYPTKRVEQMGTVQTLQLRPIPSKAITNSISSSSIKTTTIGQAKPQTRSNSNTTEGTKPPNVMPLLTPPEICRQLLELRRQNEELRRKFEVAQMEKEDLRLRLERLEQLVLTERVSETNES